jgi:hypothetical protein
MNKAITTGYCLFLALCMAPGAPLAADDTNAPPPDDRQRIDALEQKVIGQQAQIEQLGTEMQEMRDTQELEQFSGAIDKNAQSKLQIFGFFDFTFSKYFFRDDSAYNVYFGDSWTFLMNNINVYILSQMTPQLSALLELRFSFLPNGFENDYPKGPLIDGERGELIQDSYDRTNSTIRDSFSTAYFTPGSVTIERALLTWSPLEWFNVMVGRYLTPYGIWNLDHGSPVVIPVRLPYLQIREMVPLSQLGVEIYGRFFPMTGLSLNYAVTVSNGRGPMDTVLDLDDNKAVGVKLQAVYNRNWFGFNAGGYVYYGSYTDHTKAVYVDAENQTVEVGVKPVNAYDELCVAADLLVRIDGLVLQSEYVWRFVKFDTPFRMEGIDLLMQTGDPLETYGPYYAANNIGQDVYLLLSYTLPLARYISWLEITAYLLGERNAYNDVETNRNLMMLSGGVNLRPSPFVVLKVEYGVAKLQNENYGAPLKNFATQIAVSF